MQLDQFHELEAARRAYAFLATTPPASPLTMLAASVTAQVQTLGNTIGQLDAQASAQTSAAGTIRDKASAARAAARELRSGHLVPLKKVARLLATGSSGEALSPGFAATITIPHSQNRHVLLAAAAAAVQNVTPHKDLFIARGLSPDFLDQLTAQATALSQVIGATSAAKRERVASTADIRQLLHELRSTLHVLDIGVTKVCRADRVHGPATLATWRSAKTIRKNATPTGVPVAPPPPATPAPLAAGSGTDTTAVPILQAWLAYAQGGA